MADIVRFNLNELELDSLDFTTDEKDRIILTLQGRALKNPVAPILSLTQTEVQRLIPIFENAATTVEALEDAMTYTSANDYYPIPSTTLTEYAEALTAFSSAMVAYKSHSDILSGVDLTYTGFPPNFLGRIGIAQAYNRLKESLRKTAEEGCEEENKQEIFSEMFYSILGFAENELQDIYDLILNTEVNIANQETTDRVSYIQTRIDRVTNGTANLTAFKTRDDSGFYRAYNFVTNVSVAQSLQAIKDEDFTSNLLENVNGTDLFNKEDISGLKLRCQTFTLPDSQPNNNFSEDFSVIFQQSSLGNLIDVSTTGQSQGLVLGFSSGIWTPVEKTQLLPVLKGITIDSPTSSEDITMFFTDKAITITQINAIVRGTTPSVTWTIRHDTDRSLTGNEVVTSGTTTTSTTTGSEVSSFNDATIPAGSWVWFETTAQTGTVNELNVTIEYGVD